LEFLHGIVESIEITQEPMFISNDRNWLSEIANQAYKALEKCNLLIGIDEVRSGYFGKTDNIENNFLNQDNEFLSSDLVIVILSELKPLFSDFEFFALMIENSNNEVDWINKSNKELKELAETYAVESKEKGLILLPTKFDIEDSQLSFLDPFPAVAILAEQAVSFPGILFWRNNGSATYTENIWDAGDIFEKLSNDYDENDFKDHHLFWVNSNYQRESNKILHLSDLHFGTDFAIKNRTRLKNEIRRFKNEFQRVVITGDLFDNPQKRDAIDFNDFRTDLEHVIGNEVIVIPGNHDQKLLGNNYKSFGRDLNELADLEWSNLVIDDELKCVFFCFDTAREADFARGKFSDTERDRVENTFNTKLSKKKELKDYFRIALIHHHPFTFETSKETLIQKGLRLFGISDERFLAMDNAEAFINWCANMNIPIILHGHKHIQRHSTKSVRANSGKEFEVTAIGCGTSLGAEENSLTYNLLSWSKNSNNWGITFYEDKKDGSGFKPVKITLHVEK